MLIREDHLKAVTIPEAPNSKALDVLGASLAPQQVLAPLSLRSPLPSQAGPASEVGGCQWAALQKVEEASHSHDKGRKGPWL